MQAGLSSASNHATMIYFEFVHNYNWCVEYNWPIWSILWFATTFCIFETAEPLVYKQDLKALASSGMEKINCILWSDNLFHSLKVLWENEYFQSALTGMNIYHSSAFENCFYIVLCIHERGCSSVTWHILFFWKCDSYPPLCNANNVGPS